jgi:hypothetical protein
VYSKNFIHQALKCSGCIGQPKRHNQKLVMAVLNSSPEPILIW